MTVGEHAESDNTGAPLYNHPDRNLALELVRATEAAAIRALPFVGRGDENGADGAAVDTMRRFLTTVKFAGTVVIGEGEKDEAPMLYNGEQVGTGDGPEYDIAEDPIDGTSLAASGGRNAISMIAAADRGACWTHLTSSTWRCSSPALRLGAISISRHRSRTTSTRSSAYWASW